jgi:hypothetical protein
VTEFGFHASHEQIPPSRLLAAVLFIDVYGSEVLPALSS